MPVTLQEMTSGHTCGDLLAPLYLRGLSVVIMHSSTLTLTLTLKPSVSISFSLWVIEFVPIRDFERLISHTPNAQIKNLTQNLITVELFAYVVRSQSVKCDETTPTYRNAVALKVYYTDLTLLDS